MCQCKPSAQKTSCLDTDDSQHTQACTGLFDPCNCPSGPQMGSTVVIDGIKKCACRILDYNAYYISVLDLCICGYSDTYKDKYFFNTLFWGT